MPETPETPMCLNGYMECAQLLNMGTASLAILATLACLAAVLLGMAFVKVLS